MKRYLRPAKVLLFLAGAVILIGVVKSIEPGRLLEAILAVNVPVFMAALLIYPCVCAWDTWGWYVIFPGPVRGRVRFRELFEMRLAGEAVNNVTPFVDVGGEALKIVLVSRRFGLAKKMALATVMAERTSLLISELVYWVLGLLPVFLFLPVAPAFKGGLAAVTGVFALIGLVLLFLQRRGFFATLAPRFERLGEVDRHLRSFYAARDGRWFASLFIHLIGWVAGTIETFVLLRLLGVPASWLEAFVLEALSHLIRSATFFIPGNLGTLEGGMALLIRGMGHDPALGVGLSLLKRARQAIWTALGFVAWWVLEKRPGALQSESDAVRVPVA